MEQPTIGLRKRLFIPKIDLPALLAIALFAGLIFIYLIPGFEKAMMDRKRIMIHEMTASAFSLLTYYHSLEVSGILTTEAAKEQAGSAIGTIRYGANLKDYFWITDLHPRMIVHPYRPDLNGTDLTDFRDSRGKTIFVEFVKAVTPEGESYVDYMWQWNDDSTRIVPKLSYVRLFEPWGWIIGTGLYIDDVRSEIRRMEFRAMIISGIIGLIIIILLIAVSRQSHRIENKRTRAEEELRKSRELYRTLAEASSEGVLIWSSQGLQANKTLLSWLGYAEEEMSGKTLRDLITSPEITAINDAEILYNELGSSLYVGCVLISKNGNLIKSQADLSRILMGGLRSVLVVIRPVRGNVVQPGYSPRTELLNSIETGFFRITFGRKNRFLYATAPAIGLLGYDNFQDLLPHTVESLFVNHFQFKAFTTALASREVITRSGLLLRRKNGDSFWASVSAVVVEPGSGEIWCEGTIEPLAAAEFRDNFQQADLASYSATFIMQVPVSIIKVTPVACPEDFSVSRTVAVMKENNTQVIIVSNKNGEPLGVIDSGTIGIRLAEGGSPETEIFRWMTSPPVLISEDSSIYKAFGMIRNSLQNCLLVTDKENKISGIVTQTELSQSFFKTPELIYAEIGNANSTVVLRRIFLDSRKIAVSMILGHADPYAVSMYLSSVADAMCKRVLSICTEALGEPPCRFAFIQTGSAGRMEQTFHTDQDNAIIFENLKGDPMKQAGTYFLELGRRVNEMLAATGFALCKGNNMAGNPLWCQPVNKWKKYFSDWITMPGPDELLGISVFFDFRYCYGDQGITDELREYVKTDLRTSDIFFHHMAEALQKFNPSPALSASGYTDLKKLLLPLTGVIRLYSLKTNITGYSTIDRIISLYSGRYLDSHLLHRALKAWKNLTFLRLSHQASCIHTETEPDNLVDLFTVNHEMRYFAEEAADAVNELLLKSGNDFYTRAL
jgi:PAS domain S-box-containing protein